MMPSTITKPITAEELLKMGDIGRCELLYGELVMMSPAGLEHGDVALRIGRMLQEFIDGHNLGRAFGAETGFKLESNPDLVRAPDASFVRKERLRNKLPKGFFDSFPDLAVEVVSPGDTRREVSDKTNMWLAHGTISVWVVDPATMTLTIHRTGKPPIRLGVKDELRDEPALAGFVMPLSKVFKRP